MAALPVATWVDRRDGFLTQCLFLAGLRVGEAVGLTTASFDLSNRLLYVLDGKTGAGILPLLPELAAAYQIYMDQRPPYAGDWIFLAADGALQLRKSQPLRPNGVRQMLRRRCRDAGCAI